MKINFVGAGYVVDLTRDDFYKVGRYINKTSYTAQEMADVVIDMLFQGEMYKDEFAKEYANKIVSAMKQGEA